MIPRVKEKIRVIVVVYRAKNDNSQLRIHLTVNSEFSENSELSLWPCLEYSDIENICVLISGTSDWIAALKQQLIKVECA